MEELAQEDGDLARAQALMAKHDTLAQTVARARQYGESARRALAVFPDSPIRQALIDVVDFVVEREF